ncbi:hypothetical protein [Agrobacterium sp. LMR679]|uniref:hypothetical protein n=1 Tax=Agrobacterium sp. LMR679 TaxID=3014335 RepID=UPI0022AE7872|nr:hypothetical protein [Agrobacterium sp. LMR679]MCZ4072111.1 hypothetical protein [Agrobacterium sp. LMR679]
MRPQEHESLPHQDQVSTCPSCQDADRGRATVLTAGISAISGAIMGFVFAGSFYAAAGLVVFSILAGWIGWAARELA